MIDFNPVNPLMMTIAIMQPAPSPRLSTNPQGKQICKSNLDTVHRQFSNTPKEKIQDQ